MWVSSMIACVLFPEDVWAQAPTPVTPSYTFTFSGPETDLVYAALDRASQVQSLVTGERSSRFDALMIEIKQRVMEQNAATAKAAEKPKDEPKPEAPKQ